MLRIALEEELTIVAAVAAKAGLGIVTPELLHLGNHTTVKLNPWPIVARIASGTSFDFSDGSFAREIGVASHLSSRGAPAVRPITQASPGPYIEGDCIVTLWEFVQGRTVATAQDEFMAADSLQRVHRALADVEAVLPSFITKIESCQTILANPGEAPKLPRKDRVFLERLYASLREKLEQVGGAWHPLHGDAHLDNVLISEAGAIWMDLEAACMGPTEWDVVSLPEATWSVFTGLHPALLRLFANVRSLCVAIWCWAEFDRSAATREAATYHLGELKTRFSLGASR